jgi:membrane-bound lytic murein transglycosylase
VQDAGGAIEGPGRIDAYFGDGIDALIRAGQTRTPIDVYRMRSRN